MEQTYANVTHMAKFRNDNCGALWKKVKLVPILICCCHKWALVFIYFTHRGTSYFVMKLCTFAEHLPVFPFIFEFRKHARIDELRSQNSKRCSHDCDIIQEGMLAMLAHERLPSIIILIGLVRYSTCKNGSMLHCQTVPTCDTSCVEIIAGIWCDEDLWAMDLP